MMVYAIRCVGKHMLKIICLLIVSSWTLDADSPVGRWAKSPYNPIVFLVFHGKWFRISQPSTVFLYIPFGYLT